MPKSVASLIAVLAAGVLCGKAVAAAEIPATLEEALQAHGWSAQHNIEGDLLLRPPVNQGKSSPHKTLPVAALQEDIDLQKVAARLEESGWKVQRQSDGSLVMHPPQDRVTAAKSHPAETGESASITIPTPKMRERLRDSGWQVIENSDGSMLLYPPGKHHHSNTIQPCSGAAPRIDTRLPLISWTQVRSITREWLKQYPGSGLTVGKMRRIFNVYLVSIVSSSRPHKLVHQLAVRRSDGHIIVLD